MTERPISRRTLLKTAAGAADAVVFAPMVNRGRYRLFAHSQETYSARTVRLVTDSLVIEMLSPRTINQELRTSWSRDAENFAEEDVRTFLESGISCRSTTASWPAEDGGNR